MGAQMKTTGESWRNIGFHFLQAFICAVIFGLIASALPEWLAWIPKLLVFGCCLALFALVCVACTKAVGYLLRQLGAVGISTINAVDIRSPAGHIVPITPASNVFDADGIPEAAKGLPAVKSAWLSIGSDETLLQNYATYLDAHRQKVSVPMQSAIRQFTTDHRTLLSQQKNVLRRAFQSKQHIARFKDLPQISISFSDLPQIHRLSVPASPPFLSAEQYAKKFAVLPRNAGIAITHLLRVNGGTISTGGVAAAAVAAGVTAIRAKGMISKSLRALERSRGEVNVLCAESKAEMVLLKEAHAEMVRASCRMREVADEIDHLAAKTVNLPATTTTLEALTAEQRSDVKQLWLWAVSAQRVSRTSI